METAVIKKYCREWIKSSDVKMLDTAKFAVCTRFNKNDKAPELMKPDVIVKAMNESIGSIFKKLRMKLNGTAITEKSVIFIQNYAENVRDKKRTKYNKIEAADWDEHTPDVKESLDRAFAAMGRLEPVFTVRQDDVNRRLMLALFEDIGRKRARRLLAEVDDEEFTIRYMIPEKPDNPDGKLHTLASYKVKKGEKFTKEPDPEKEGWIPNGYWYDDESIKWKYVRTGTVGKNDVVLSKDDLDSVTQDITAILMLVKDEGENDERFVKVLKQKGYIKNFDKQVKRVDKDYFKNKKFQKDFDISGKNAFSCKKGEEIDVEKVKKLIKALVGEGDEDLYDKAVLLFDKDTLRMLLDITQDSKESSRYSNDAYGNKTEWFMYIVPMPGGDRKNDDDNKKEGVEAK